MWFFKKKQKVESKPKEYHYVKAEPKKLTLKVYEVKIYNEAGKEIGKTCVGDAINWFDKNGNFYSSEHQAVDYPVNCEVDKNSLQKFQYFKEWKNLQFEDFDYNQVSLDTDMVKKVVISATDECEQEVQLYKWVEKT